MRCRGAGRKLHSKRNARRPVEMPDRVDERGGRNPSVGETARRKIIGGGEYDPVVVENKILELKRGNSKW